jgi:hypothetical protein
MEVEVTTITGLANQDFSIAVGPNSKLQSQTIFLS